MALSHSQLLCVGKIIKVDAHRTTVGGKRTYGCVNMADFLQKLIEKLEPNPTSLRNFKRMYSPKGLHKVDSKAPLETSVLYDRVQVGPWPALTHSLAAFSSNVSSFPCAKGQ